MENKALDALCRKKNIVLLGEAGCGKSEIALNAAYALKNAGFEVQLFDMDMTKPLFRSRDFAEKLKKDGIGINYQEQFMDAPVVAGGVVYQLKNEDCHTILDVGGDYIGARSIGGYAPYINQDNTAVYYIVNPFRPWSLDAGWAAQVLSEILGVSHIKADTLRFIGNPNLGGDTSAKDVLDGIKRLGELVDESRIEFICIEEHLAKELSGKIELSVLPIKRYLAYPW